jgi:hypothetical protein
LLKLTEKGRDEIIDLFYDGKEKRELKRLIKKADLHLKKRVKNNRYLGMLLL